MNILKFCKDCKHRDKINCTHPERPTSYLVTGDIKIVATCHEVRYNSSYCGPEGKWFEARDVDPGEGWRLLVPDKDTIQSEDEFTPDSGKQWIVSPSTIGQPYKLGLNPGRRRVQPEITKCVCWRTPMIVGSFVRCPEVMCWSGPACNTSAETIEAWNKVMSKATKC